MKPYDLTQTDEVLRWMRGGQFRKGYKDVAVQLAQAMRICDDLRKWCQAEPCPRDSNSKVGSMIIEPAGPEAYSGFEAAQAEVQWFLDDAVRWDDEKGVV